MAFILDFLLVLSSLLALSNAHNIQMKAHSRECFHETLHKDDKMTVTFQVGDREFGGSGNLDIDFWVRLPQTRDGNGRRMGELGAMFESSFAYGTLPASLVEDQTVYGN